MLCVAGVFEVPDPAVDRAGREETRLDRVEVQPAYQARVSLVAEDERLGRSVHTYTEVGLGLGLNARFTPYDILTLHSRRLGRDATC